jgi:hypothetical protein
LIGVEEKIKKINESKLNGSLKSLLLIIEEKEIEKGKKPYKKIEGIDYSTIQDNFKLYVETVSQIIKILEEIESKITDFKQQYEDTSKIQEIIAKIIKEIEKLEYQKIRIEQDYNCIAYLKEKKEITTLSSKITTDTNKLDTDQNTYLQKYFKEINELFKKF